MCPDKASVSECEQFQRLALVTQFLTIFGGIIYLMTECLDNLHEVQPDPGNQVASELLAIFILVINWVTAVLYPLYRLVFSLTDSKGWLAAFYQGLVRSCTQALRVCTPSSDSGSRSTPLEAFSWSRVANMTPDQARNMAAVASAVALRHKRNANGGVGVEIQAPQEAVAQEIAASQKSEEEESQRGDLRPGGVFVPLVPPGGQPASTNEPPRLGIQAELGVLEY